MVYRQLAYNNHPDIPRTDPHANAAWYTEWLMVEQPEQSRYTADLTIFWQDLTKTEDNYVFVPALRRSLRLSATARCSPLLGSDMIHDDQRGGYNGGLNLFNANYLGEREDSRDNRSHKCDRCLSERIRWPIRLVDAVMGSLEPA